MASHARHARSASKESRALRRRMLLRVGLTVSAGAAFAAGGAASASADTGMDGGTSTGMARAQFGETNIPAAIEGANKGLGAGAEAVFDTAKTLRTNPFAGTPVDPFDNTVGTKVGNMKPVTTKPATQPISNGGSLTDLPVAGNLTSLLPTGRPAAAPKAH
ncbi:hypothetical protein V7793_12065 [Streptomyces sp. KLMMK]|uniref:ATP-binding protein n=1 Tax=Streptomyces telluris TaxID=2720021 RepID=A0A9X2LEC2_9ACTN|nr:hypothetical protein [Streptomyces telluris]MCQ8769374.1 hypothetical protein [Streptomyces telluris]NJP77126.1 hypothetical protein [Streptomyces telluris]